MLTRRVSKGNKVETENSFSINYDELNGRFDFDFYSPENRRMFTKLDNSKTVRLGDICEIIKVKSKKETKRFKFIY